MKKERFLVIITLIIVGVGVFLVSASSPKPQIHNIDITDQLTLGNPNARAKVVTFIDFRCPACVYFEKEIFPLLNKKYIQTEKISYTLIPIAFLDGSARLLQGYYCSAAQDSSSRLAYIQQAMGQSTLPKIAGINQSKLKVCLASYASSQYVDNNSTIAHKAMGRQLATPTVYVNGRQLSTFSYTAISKAIDEAL